MAGKSSSSSEEVNWSGAAVGITNARPVRRALLAPNDTSCDVKLKWPCVVLTSSVTGVLLRAMVTISPFSWKSPFPVSLGPDDVMRTAIFQLEVPAIKSVPVNRQPFRLKIVPPVAVMEPSQLVSALSPMPTRSRKDSALGEAMGAAGVEVWGNKSRRPPKIAKANRTTKANRIRMGLTAPPDVARTLVSAPPQNNREHVESTP